jgi:hypothetical protein
MLNTTISFSDPRISDEISIPVNTRLALGMGRTPAEITSQRGRSHAVFGTVPTFLGPLTSNRRY